MKGDKKCKNLSGLGGKLGVTQGHQQHSHSIQQPREGDISRIRRQARNEAIVLNFVMRGVIADVITHPKFFTARQLC